VHHRDELSVSQKIELFDEKNPDSACPSPFRIKSPSIPDRQKHRNRPANSSKSMAKKQGN
jgi:hypothetical protein